MKNYITYILLVITIYFSSCGNGKLEIKPERKNITETVFASGTMEPDNKYNLTAQTDGYITELYFENGDIVKAEQVLAKIDNKTNNIVAGSAGQLAALASINANTNGPTLSQAKQNKQLMLEKFNQDSLQFSRYQKLAASNSVSKLELENARIVYETSKTNFYNAVQNYLLLKQQTEQQLITQNSQRDANLVSSEYNQIKALKAGKIYKKLKEVGDYVRRGDVIAVIGDDQKLYAKLNVDESNISKIKIGQKVTIQLNTNKDFNYEAKISEIQAAFDESSQSFICEADFDSIPSLKISGTQLQANIVIGTKQQALVIPRAYLDYGNKVMVKGKTDAQIVKTGFVSSDWVEILEGLNETDVLMNPKK